MKSETLQFLAPLSETNAVDVSRVLSAIKGVANVAAASNGIQIQFDDNLTSIQELRTTLQRAGFDVKKPVHGEDGVCCGSCS
jgi:CCGSCS motif protein